MVPSQKDIQNLVFGVILILLFLVVCRLFQPFFTALLWSILFYVVFSPLHKRVVKKIDVTKLHGRVLKNVWAAVFAVGTVVLILVPVIFVTFQFLKQIIDLLRFTRDTINTRPEMINDALESVSAFIDDITLGQIVIEPETITKNIVSTITSSLQGMVQISSNVVRNVGSFLMGLALMIFCLFFFYIDGSYLSHLFLHVIPIRKEYLSALVAKFMDITRNLFLGYIMVALIQAIIAFVIFSVFQVKGSLVFAALTFICVFIPMIGGGLVWIPLGVIRIISGDISGGILFTIIAGLGISMVDNFLRPIFLQDRIQLHPLIIFFAILGGVNVFGFNGLIVGPIMVILFLTVLDMFLAEHDMTAG
jgi:predicted PurR-regulated permease PerM